MICIIGGFGIPGKNDNRWREVHFWAERTLCVMKRLHKYTRVARVHDREEVVSMVNLVYDVKGVGGMGQVFSDHHVVLCKVRLVGIWVKRREVVNGVRNIRSEKLRENQYL